MIDRDYRVSVVKVCLRLVIQGEMTEISRRLYNREEEGKLLLGFYVEKRFCSSQ